MSTVSRRTFLAGAGVAAGTIGVSGLLGPAVAAADDVDAPDGADDVTSAQPIVARVRNARTGAISVYVGTEEVTLTDRVVAGRLARAARRAG